MLPCVVADRLASHAAAGPLVQGKHCVATQTSWAGLGPMSAFVMRCCSYRARWALMIRSAGIPGLLGIALVLRHLCARVKAASPAAMVALLKAFCSLEGGPSHASHMNLQGTRYEVSESLTLRQLRSQAHRLRPAALSPAEARRASIPPGAGEPSSRTVRTFLAAQSCSSCCCTILVLQLSTEELHRQDYWHTDSSSARHR